MRRPSLHSLGVRMVLLFSALLVAIAGFMAIYFPAHMEAQAESATRLRARALAAMVARTLAPAVEFEDADNAAAILAHLEATPDATFALVHDAHGHVLARWRTAAPGFEPPAYVTGTIDHEHGELLVVSAPIVGRGDGGGALHLGFSLRGLRELHDTARHRVALASAAVLVLGIAACVLLASLLLRPIHRLTDTARRIARGDLPPRLTARHRDDEVGQMTQALDVMLARLDGVNQQLIDASRHAGMAQVATGVLHNVGNVLNSVNVDVELLHERAAGNTVARLRRAVELVDAEHDATPATTRTAARRLLAAITDRLEAERRDDLDQLGSLRGHVDHVKRTVMMQNAYARVGGVIEVVEPGRLLDDALAIACPDPERHGITVHRRITGDARAAIDHNRVLQILVNLIANARDAVAAADERTIAVEVATSGGEVRIAVRDTGTGIAAEQLPRMFSAGFTTKPTGHGFGLHSSAQAARQLGGTLRCASDGLGRGATFTLVIPAQDLT